MFTRHVVKQLSAFYNGELSDAESRRVREHLLSCKRCREEHDEIKLGVKLAEQIHVASAPEEMWSEIDAMLDAQARRPVLQPATPRFGMALDWYSAAAVAAVIVVAVATGLWWTLYQGPKVSWAVQEAIGSVRIDGGQIRDAGKLAVGETLETGRSSKAKITVANIGEVEVDPDTRIRLVKTQETEHRLALDHGRIKARIKAPPRLFFVDTPAAVAVDLGCEYTLEVDDSGSSLLHVTLGFVALVRNGREVWVPRFAMCQARHGIGPGTPYFDDASAAFVSALERFDFESGGDEALRTVLNESRERDTFTLWQLLSRVNGDQRVRVLDRMIELVGLPKEITRDAILKLDQKSLDAWKDELTDTVWF
ncbi:MAG TPA: zf-HC2 domain-containing protein [Blastocatellia bacterium]|nr:zf-HC2 domain-containing protein [Blastocatellia bacterium]